MRSVLCIAIFGFLTVNALSYYHYPGKLYLIKFHLGTNKEIISRFQFRAYRVPPVTLVRP